MNQTTTGTDAARASTMAGSGTRVVRMLVVAAVLCAEFTFLMWVYHLDDKVDAHRVALNGTQVLLDAGLAGGTGLSSTLEDSVAEMVSTGTPGAATVRSASRGDLSDPAAVQVLSDSIDSSQQLVDEEGTSTDRLVLEILLSVFVVICIFWFLWFSRLAKRHRALQHDLTQREVAATGERRLQALVHNSSDLIAVLDGDSAITYASEASASILGTDSEELADIRFADLVLPADRPFFARMLALPGLEEHELSLRVRHADGRELICEGTLKNLHDDVAVRGWVLTLRDVTERRRLEDTLSHQAFHDTLTGLANRQLFADRLQHALTRRETSRTPLSLLFLDLDDFKVVNDSLGHQVGDQLLVEVSRRMSQVLRAQDTVARLGGDEFAVLLEDTETEIATQTAQRLLAAFSVPVDVQGQLHPVQASIGVATLARGAQNDDDLMRNADVAMYHAKDAGKARFAIYDPAVHEQAMAQLQLRIDLAQAIRNHELVLHYQPTVNFEMQTVTGFEALVRWNHPRRGLIPPNDFIGLAEQSGLIVALGTWVLGEACRAGSSMQGPNGGPSMAVNVAAQQLTDPDFCDIVTEALASSGLPAHRLVLEITETAFVADLDTSVAALHRLRAKGVRIAIDDFGTGYNSLSTLAALPVDVLKVDKSFIDRLGGPSHDSSLVEAILSMSSSLNLVTVAEGVEELEQAAWLREHRTTTGQGYLWSRPVELAAAQQLLLHGVRRHLDHTDGPGDSAGSPRIDPSARSVSAGSH